MRPEVQAFVADGKLPDRDSDDQEELERRCDRLEAISAPVTADEAHALAACFGPDDCYGVAWSLLHLIETGPGPLPPVPPPEAHATEWHHTLWSRWGDEDLA
ncbi:hypothetical protein ACGFYY_04960 [Streptomyces sp. NPDC048331]|uniref:hypothetical protein n=1 Tax=Streptomyces sp. NPDC048331 TaxID=3365534 RepID=UPI003720B40D